MPAHNMNTYTHFITVTECILCEVSAEAKDTLLDTERFFKRLPELQEIRTRLRKASRPSAASSFLRCHIKRPLSCTMNHTETEGC